MLRKLIKLPKRPSGEEQSGSQKSLVNEHHADLMEIKLDDTRKERKQKLKASFRRNQVEMFVSTDDIIIDENDEADQTDLYEGGSLMIHAANTNNMIEKKQHLSVPNCCIICLESYQPNDHVVWSSNPQCQHAFHRSCIMKYLVRIHKRAGCTPCPCCRRDFTDLHIEQKKARLQMALITIQRFCRRSVSRSN